MPTKHRRGLTLYITSLEWTHSLPNKPPPFSLFVKKYARGGNNMAWIIDEKEAQRIAKEIEEANKKWNQEKEQENKDKD
ncbi:hypothetical protein ADA01nite_33950 [Aneurinibacillus danicus]|uniref:Uncharacterized protein n=1 Tax=Aneurinibacillus danicus TaxID=267746 RepID=A0A511VAI6_9BACL|nr:hypothetical protein ADA01nite_33950 [Aneurinibacillus danicus]